MKKDLITPLKQLISILDEDGEKSELINKLKKTDRNALKLFLKISCETKISTRSASQINHHGIVNPIRSAHCFKLIKEELINILAKIEDDSNYYSIDYRSKNIFILKRKMIDLEILKYRGLRDFTSHELDNLIDQFLRLEDYEDALVALEKKRIYYKIYKGARDVNKLEEKILQTKAKKNALDKAMNIHLNCGKQLASIKAQSEINMFFEKSISELETLYKSTKSKLILYYLLFTKYAYSEDLNDFNNTDKHLDSLESLLLRSKIVFTHNRFHQFLLNKSFFNIKIGQMNIAIKLIHKSFLYTNSIYNNLLGRHLLSHIWLAQGNQERLQFEIDLIDQAISENSLPNDFTPKHFVLKAAYYFTKKNYNKCLEILTITESNSGLDDETRIKLRLLKIITLIELDRKDEAEYSIDNFRKLVERSKNSRLFTPRIVLIKKLLVALSSTDFNYGRKSAKVFQLIKKLEKEVDCRWRFVSSEPIPIDIWLTSKINNNNSYRFQSF